MLGPAKLRRLDQPIAVSLEDLVPQDHYYRHFEATLDLSFVREWARELYADRCRPSIDPVIFFKLPLIMFLKGIRAECHGGIQASHLQAPGLGGTARCRVQGVARLTPAAPARLAEREHPGIADRGGPEPQAHLARDGMGAASCALWKPSSGEYRPVRRPGHR
jgi:hypothetical protein